MKTIYKYPLMVKGNQAVVFPKGAKILSAQSQAGVLCLWAEVDTDIDSFEGRNIEIYGTGHEMSDLEYGLLRIHLGTTQMGPLVWHVYERINLSN